MWIGLLTALASTTATSLSAGRKTLILVVKSCAPMLMYNRTFRFGARFCLEPEHFPAR